MNKTEIAAILTDIGTLLELKGENPFKVRAYAAGARLLETLGEDEITRRVADGTLDEVKGIGGFVVPVQLLDCDLPEIPEWDRKLTHYLYSGHAIALNGSFFNTHRMLGQYVANAYFPLASSIAVTDQVIVDDEAPVSVLA